jgi:hypothetical protein
VFPEFEEFKREQHLKLVSVLGFASGSKTLEVATSSSFGLGAERGFNVATDIKLKIIYEIPCS